MDGISIICLLLTILLSVGRNILSKNISNFPFGKRNFFNIQTVIFVGGSLVLLPTVITNFTVAPITVLYAIIYGTLLLTAQWFYTMALKHGNTGVCATVYSLGFIFPTMSGCIFWQEELSIINFIGIMTVIPAVVISGNKTTNTVGEKDYIIPLVVAMLSSGGLGIMQKVQQASLYPEQRNEFVLIAFCFAGVISMIASFFTKWELIRVGKKKKLYAACVGVCFGSCNLLNTFLAGRLDSAVFFPMLNIGVILLSLFMGMIVFKERIQKKEIIVLALGILSILLLNF